MACVRKMCIVRISHIHLENKDIPEVVVSENLGTDLSWAILLLGTFHLKDLRLSAISETKKQTLESRTVINAGSP